MTRFSKKLLGASLLLALLGAHPTFSADLVDLHGHFFIAETSGLPGVGDFSQNIHATDWASHFKTRVNGDLLNQSGVKIAVVALYSHPLFPRSFHKGGERAALRYELEQVFHFVDTHSNWTIARSPADARDALKLGKRVLVLSIEGSRGVLENETDIHEFIEENGVRIVTPYHFMDSTAGGAAFMPWRNIWVNPWALLKSLFVNKHDSEGVRVNSNGADAKGKALIQALLDKHVWIDLSHASDSSVADILPILQAAHQPLLYTHTVMRSDFQAERGITPEALKEVAKSQGLVGLLPSDDMLKGTHTDPNFCAQACNGSCDGGEAAFATQFAEMAQYIPANMILFGSDIQAPLTFLKPECQALEQQDPKGYWNYSQLPKLENFLIEKGLIPQKSSMVESFLKAWELAYKR